MCKYGGDPCGDAGRRSLARTGVEPGYRRVMRLHGSCTLHLPRLAARFLLAGLLACTPDAGKDSGGGDDTATYTVDTSAVDSGDRSDTADTGDTSTDDTGDTAHDTADTSDTGDTADTGTSDPRDLPDGACRTWEDCADAEMCVDEDTPTCGTCRSAVRDCETDRECGDGHVCNDYTPTCSCGDGPSSMCVPACTTDVDCGDGEQCDLTMGQCVPWSCTDGYSCASQHDCTPGSGGTDCLRRTCGTDAACAGDGWCVNGACFDTVGVCELPRP